MKKRKILLVILIILLSSGSILLASSITFKSSGTFGNPSEVYKYISQGITTSNDKYPFTAGKVTAVGFDIIYGTSKDLVAYTGEVPYRNTRDKDGKTYTGFKNKYYREYSPDISNEDYWGKTNIVAEKDENGMQGSGEVDLQTMEAVNKDGVKSLRFFAIANTKWSRQWIYWILKTAAWIGSQLIYISIMIKSLDFHHILEALNIEALQNVIADLFVGRRTESGAFIPSPMYLMAFLILLVTIVKYAFKMLRGETSIKLFVKEVGIVALIGLMLIGTSRASTVRELSNNVSHLAGTFLQDINPVLGDPDSIWVTRTSGKDSSPNTDLQYSEMSLINKIYIDMQIATQFGVSRVEELDFEALGDSNGRIANDTLVGYNVRQGNLGVDPISKNLGYYFWFANSGAKQLTSNHVPEITENQDMKLTSMITYLQKMYNIALEKGDTLRAEKIKSLTLHLASPTGASGVINMIGLTAVFFLMALVLWKYSLRSAINVILLLISVVVIPIAGILILTAKDKLVKTGKGILGISYMAVLKLIVFSLMFDLIVFAVGTILTASLVSMVVVGVLLVIFRKIQPRIDYEVNKLLKKTENSLLPSAVQMKQNVKAWTIRKGTQWQTDLSKWQTKVGEDEYGNDITRQNKLGKFMSNSLDFVMNTAQESPAHKKSVRRIFKDNIKESKIEKKYTRDKLNKAEIGKVNVENDKLNLATKDNKVDFNSDISEKADEKLNEIKQHGVYNTKELTKEEKDFKNDVIDKDKVLLSNLQNNNAYKHLAQLEEKGTLPEIDKERLDKFRQQEIELTGKIEQGKIDLDTRIKDRLEKEERIKNKDNIVSKLEKQRELLSERNNNKKLELDTDKKGNLTFKETDKTGSGMVTLDELKEEILAIKNIQEAKEYKKLSTELTPEEEKVLSDHLSKVHKEQMRKAKVHKGIQQEKIGEELDLRKELDEALKGIWQKKSNENSNSNNSKKEDSNNPDIPKSVTSDNTDKLNSNEELNDKKVNVKLNIDKERINNLDNQVKEKSKKRLADTSKDKE